LNLSEEAFLTSPSYRIEIENFISPGYVYRVDRANYEAMRDALPATLPSGGPGITVSEAKTQLLLTLPQALFTGGDKAGWWLKAAHTKSH
jgi:hypothetical protein